VAPFDFTRTLAEFRATLERYQQAAGTVFSFDRAKAAVGSLDALVAKLNQTAATLGERPATDPAVRRLNAAVRSLARHLVPINFTTRTAFYHDHAELVPPLPDLAPALELPTASADRQGFIRTHLTRGHNRLLATLQQAADQVASAL
jgi:hypothetical protein